MSIGSFGVVLDEGFHGDIFLVDDMAGWCMNGRYEISMMALLLLCKKGRLKVKATTHRHTYRNEGKYEQSRKHFN